MRKGNDEVEEQGMRVKCQVCGRKYSEETRMKQKAWMECDGSKCQHWFHYCCVEYKPKPTTTTGFLCHVYKPKL